MSGSPGVRASLGRRLSAFSRAGSSTRYSMRSLTQVTTCSSRVSGCTRTPPPSASGSSASTNSAPLSRSTRTSRFYSVSTPAELIASIEPPSALIAIGPAGHGVLGWNGLQQPPVALGVVADFDHHAPVGLKAHADPRHQFGVGDPAREARVLHLLDQVPADQVKPVDVVQGRVAAADSSSDQDPRVKVLFSVARICACTPSERGEVPALVSRGGPRRTGASSRRRREVLQVEQVPPVMRPPEDLDSPGRQCRSSPPWPRSQSTPSAPTGAVHTLSTPLCGAIHARLVPLGEIRGLTRSGFPKRTRLGISSAMGHAYHVSEGH